MSAETGMNINEILDILPHRYPFVLVDRVLSKTLGPKYPNRVGNQIVAIKNVTFNEPFFQGHFPHRPVMPGVLILEVMAQVGALLCYRPEDPKQDVAFLGVSEAKFRKAVAPGDQLTIKMECRKDRGSFVVFGGEVYVGDDLVAEAELLAKMFTLGTPS